MKISNDLHIKNVLYELCLKHTAFTNQRINRMGLYQGQPRMLMLLWERDGMSQSELVEALDLSQPTVAKTIERLEKKGILLRKIDQDDRRMVHIFLTPLGRSMQRSVMQSFEQMAQQLLQGFDQDEKELLESLLLRIKNNISGDLNQA